MNKIPIDRMGDVDGLGRSDLARHLLEVVERVEVEPAGCVIRSAYGICWLATPTSV